MKLDSDPHLLTFDLIKEIDMITNFSLDSFRITDTRSRHEDTDFVTISISA